MWKSPCIVLQDRHQKAYNQKSKLLSITSSFHKLLTVCRSLSTFFVHFVCGHLYFVRNILILLPHCAVGYLQKTTRTIITVGVSSNKSFSAEPNSPRESSCRHAIYMQVTATCTIRIWCEVLQWEWSINFFVRLTNQSLEHTNTDLICVEIWFFLNESEQKWFGVPPECCTGCHESCSSNIEFHPLIFAFPQFCDIEVWVDAHIQFHSICVWSATVNHSVLASHMGVVLNTNQKHGKMLNEVTDHNKSPRHKRVSRWNTCSSGHFGLVTLDESRGSRCTRMQTWWWRSLTELYKQDGCTETGEVCCWLGSI